MRTLITVSIPVGPGNKAIKEGTIEKTMGEFMQNHRPESAIFTTKNGNRTAYFVIDLKDVSMMPTIAEPFFSQFEAAVDFSPAMNAEELKKGIEQLRGAMAGAR